MSYRKPLPSAKYLSVPVAAVVLLFASAVFAQQGPQTPLGGESPTAGVRLTTPSLVGNGDASSLETNPGALGMLPSWSLFYHHTSNRQGGRVAGNGDAFLLAAPLPFGGITLSTGLQWLRPIDAVGYADSVKLSFGMALRAGSRFALGLAYHTFISDKDPALDSIDTLDLGLVVRPTQWLAAGFVIHDLTTPLYDGLPLQRVYDFELALRPLLSDRLEIGAGLRIGERRGDLDPHFRLEIEPLRGLRLLGDLELMRRDFYRNGDEAMDVRATIGLAFNLERIGMRFSTTLGRPLDRTGPVRGTDASGMFQGIGFSVALSGQAKQPLFETRKRLIALEGLKGRLTQAKMARLVGVIQQIERRKDVAGVVIWPDRLGVGWAQAQEIRSLIKRLRRAGKKTYAYLRTPNSRQYYIAAAAEKVWLDPAADLRLAGVAAMGIYLRGFLDLIGAEPQFVKIAKYKTAPERLTHKKSSAEAKEVREALLDQFYGQLVRDLARDRKKSVAAMKTIIDQGPFTSADSLSKNLVDKLVEPDRAKMMLQRHARAALASAASLRRASGRWQGGPALAMIAIEGDIVSGKSRRVPLIGQQTAGGETIVTAINWARNNSRVKAIVIRINSPGGSALASARMWRAIRRARKAKPVIVSLADVAASGGYYAACAADRIYAQPSTITGSIGIFSGKFNVSGLMGKLGLTSESSQRGKNALLQAFDRNYSKRERALVKKRLRFHYNKFVKAVAEGRKMKFGEVDKVARGRVWTGKQAKGRMLVDAHGGLLEALYEAKRRAGLPRDRAVPLYILPRARRPLVTRLLKMVNVNAKSSTLPLPADIKRMLRGLPPVLFESRSGEPLSRLPFAIDVGQP